MTKQLEALIARKGCAVTGNYYLAECGNCGEMFTSERMTGGEPIADTGDYGDCYCPHCDTDDSDIIDCGTANSSAAEAWNYQQKHIDALIAALEQAEQYAKQRDEENQDLMLTIGRLRVEREQLEASPLASNPATWVDELVGDDDWSKGGRAMRNAISTMFAMKHPASPLAVKRPGTTCLGWVKEAIHEHDDKWIEAIRAAGGKVEGE